MKFRSVVLVCMSAFAVDAPSPLTNEEKLIFENIALRQQILQRDFAEAYNTTCAKRSWKREECIVDGPRGIVMRKMEAPPTK